MTTDADNKEQPKSGGGTARYLLALIPLIVFACIAFAVGKVMYDQEVHGTDISAIPERLAEAAEMPRLVFLLPPPLIFPPAFVELAGQQ